MTIPFAVHQKANSCGSLAPRRDFAVTATTALLPSPSTVIPTAIPTLSAAVTLDFKNGSCIVRHPPLTTNEAITDKTEEYRLDLSNGIMRQKYGDGDGNQSKLPPSQICAKVTDLWEEIKVKHPQATTDNLIDFINDKWDYKRTNARNASYWPHYQTMLRTLVAMLIVRITTLDPSQQSSDTIVVSE